VVKVALIKCESYDYDKVKEAVARGISLIGGPEAFVNKGEKILLKPNLLSADPPERCSTTHFTVFKAVGEVLKEAGASLSYGDSPAFHSPLAAAKKAKIAAAADELNIPLADFVNGEDVHYHEGVQNKVFKIAKGVLESDGLVSISKLKTHGFARMTGTIKNQFGCVPGTLKGEFHVKIPDANNFAKMLVDLNMFLKPRLFVMDGIMAMEGNGPRGGTPKQMNVLLFSSDPVALDATVCRIVDLNPEFVPTTKFGKEAGLGTYIESEIEIVGDKIEDFYKKDFNVVREPVKPYNTNTALRYLQNMLVPKPVIRSEKCIKCGVCVKMCPVDEKPVNWHDGDKSKVPSHIYKKCIRCFCCQELCPESAIDLKVPLIRKFIGKS
jgi:uncharacterized protein (DUF362 family)/NAD-dependent dihydropyrimidine dehydrogenase PreA subunit